MLKSLLIIIPAHNEADSIKNVICNLFENGYSNILVVNDASSDDTALIAEGLGVKVMNLPYNLGAWRATQAGVRYAEEQGFQNVITFDADGQHLGETLSQLIKIGNETKADIVIGSCTQRGTLSRHIAWTIFRTLSGVGVQDLTSGLRLYNKAAISVLSTKGATLLEYQDVGVLLLLRTFKLLKVEVEVPMKKRENGKSRIFYSWGTVAYYMAYTTMLCISKFKKNKQQVIN